MPPAAILQVLATDADIGDAGIIKYSIKSGNRNDAFRIDSGSGILYPSKSLHGERGQFSMEIEATDDLGRGNSAFAEVIIDIYVINQNKPNFILPDTDTIEIQEKDAVQGYLVTVAKAEDSDEGDNGKISYSLQGSNDFSMDAETGEIRFKQSFSNASSNKHELILIAKDHGVPAPFETPRFLTVFIVSEEDPKFPETTYKFLVPESHIKISQIGQVESALQGKNHYKVFYHILYGNDDGTFYIDMNSGAIFTKKTLNYQKQYTFWILASRLDIVIFI